MGPTQIVEAKHPLTENLTDCGLRGTFAFNPAMVLSLKVKVILPSMVTMLKKEE